MKEQRITIHEGLDVVVHELRADQFEALCTAMDTVDRGQKMIQCCALFLNIDPEEVSEQFSLREVIAIFNAGMTHNDLVDDDPKQEAPTSERSAKSHLSVAAQTWPASKLNSG